jgi:hypothetical protein
VHLAVGPSESDMYVIWTQRDPADPQVKWWKTAENSRTRTTAPMEQSGDPMFDVIMETGSIVFATSDVRTVTYSKFDFCDTSSSVS